MWSPVFFGIGMVFAGGGALAVLTGLVIRADASEECTGCPAEEKRSLALSVALAGGGAMLLGVPAAIVGGRQVPDKPSWARVVPSVFVSPWSWGGALRFAF